MTLTPNNDANCPACGAPLGAGRTCRDYFHDLLALEAQVPGGPGREPHFLAVAAYNLQHPDEFELPMLLGLRETVAEVLAGRATVDDALRRARRATDGATRVRRRVGAILSGEEQRAIGAWPRRWPVTVRDACDVAPVHYAERVREWATAVIAVLEATSPQGASGTFYG